MLLVEGSDDVADTDADAGVLIACALISVAAALREDDLVFR